MPTTACPCCGRKLRIPDRLAGRRVTCPRCNEALAVPASHEPLPGAGDGVPAPLDAEPLPLAARLGFTALALGLVSVLVLCVPVVGYAAMALSGFGLFLGLWGLLLALTTGTGTPAFAPAGGAGGPRPFGVRARDYPLAGLAACVLALALALLPFLIR